MSTYTSFSSGLSVFKFKPDGEFDMSESSMHSVEEWFAENIFIISLVSGINSPPLKFTYGSNNTEVALDNQKTMRHIYSLSYTVLLRFSAACK